MDKFKQIETFVTVALKGSLSAAARLENVAPAIIGRRIDGLEERLGVKLLVRTTRRVTLTHEGSAFLEDCQRILQELSNAEAGVTQGGVKASGHIRITAPAGFGRQHVAPLVPLFLTQNQEVSIALDLADRYVDLVNESIDLAIRIGQLADSSLVSVRLADNPRVVVAAPTYLQRYGTPQHPSELVRHQCLTLGQQSAQYRGWQFLIRDTEIDHTQPPQKNNEPQFFKVTSHMECNDGSALLDWAIAGHGLAWRSMWEVRHALSSGKLITVLNEYAAPPVGIYAVFPQRRHLPLRVRLFIDMLKACYADADYWLTGKIPKRLSMPQI